MPLSAQEGRCVGLATAYLRELFGGEWKVTEEPDDDNPAVPSPDAIVSNGRLCAAIEVKRLSVAEINQYQSWKPSLERRLRPDCPGAFLLIPCDRFSLPLEESAVRLLQREVARVAPLLKPTAVGQSSSNGAGT